MAITPIWTAHCDHCSHWNDAVMGDRKGEVTRAARRLGWLVTREIVLCPKCHSAIPEQGAGKE